MLCCTDDFVRRQQNDCGERASQDTNSSYLNIMCCADDFWQKRTEWLWWVGLARIIHIHIYTSYKYMLCCTDDFGRRQQNDCGGPCKKLCCCVVVVLLCVVLHWWFLAEDNRKIVVGLARRQKRPLGEIRRTDQPLLKLRDLFYFWPGQRFGNVFKTRLKKINQQI